MGVAPSASRRSLSSGREGADDQLSKVTRVRRGLAFTEGRTAASVTPLIPPGCEAAAEADFEFIAQALSKLLLFGNIEETVQRKIVSETYERKVPAGEILIKQGDKGQSARELYIVKEGKFEVLELRQGVMMLVNMKERGDCFGEISLMFDFPRSATVAATTDAVVWVLTRETCRKHLKELQKTEDQQSELFLNSVPILDPLSNEEKKRLVGALETVTYEAGDIVIRQGDHGDLFYIIREGEAVVYETSEKGKKKVNHLFKSDFFGEAALLSNEPRKATIEAITKLTCLTLNRETFVEILGPLSDLMQRQKSSDAVESRLALLQTKGAPSQVTAEVHIKRRRKLPNGEFTFDIVVTKGHIDEVSQLRKGGSKLGAESSVGEDGTQHLTLTEGSILGGGAFSRVSEVHEESTGRKYALKCMQKAAVAQCPEHVFCEQIITRNVAHPFCIRQYASFQDAESLYFLFDLMPGGDLMDVLVAEAKVIKRRMAQGTFRRACLAPKKKMLQGMNEPLARFYIASLVLALEYLHDNNIVYRDLKPENVFVDDKGFIKLGDFGFAKTLETGRTYTFCGTPGYVAPENVLAQGYNYSVDWWGLGVLLYVLLTGRQPFTNPRTDDPMVVMRRIVDENWPIAYPPYLSPAAKDLIGRLLERRPVRRLGMLIGQASDVKRHRWFEGFDWEALESRMMEPPRRPNEDSKARIQELDVAEKANASANQSAATSAPDSRECDVIFADF